MTDLGSERLIPPNHSRINLENTMAGTTTQQWPSLTYVRQQAEVATNQSNEPARTPTWPAHLEPLNNAVIALPQPNLLLELARILEWEISYHDHTRAQLYAEHARCEQQETQIWKLKQDLVHWRRSCDTVYAALNEHRAEHASLQRDMEGVLTELAQLRQQDHESKVSHLDRSKQWLTLSVATDCE
jgi:septal ring factor EnvC (AmiA/AmiB activator)